MVQTFKQHQRPRVAFNKLQKRLRRQVGKAIEDYHMIEDGDRVMVCLSGGKDSYTMLDILLGLQKSAPIRFDIVAVNMDQKQPGFPEEVLPSYLDSLNIEYYIVEKDTYSIVKSVVPEGKTTCALCSRLRRGTLYGFAEKINATKLALGHHRDDIVETLFLNMFHGGRLKAMPPKLLADDRRNVLIRPLAYCSEEDIAAFAAQKGFPIIPCNLCGSQENLQRKKIKAMLKQWELDSPGRVNTIFSSLQRVSLSQLADQGVFDFKGLRLDRNTTEGNGSDGDDSKGNDSKGNDSKGNDSKGNDSKGNDSKGNDSKGNDSKGNRSEGNSSSGLVDQRDSVEACLSGMNAIPVVNLG